MKIAYIYVKAQIQKKQTERCICHMALLKDHLNEDSPCLSNSSDSKETTSQCLFSKALKRINVDYENSNFKNLKKISTIQSFYFYKKCMQTIKKMTVSLEIEKNNYKTGNK